ncbi:unnamed protein product [Owenia fusiformis]|uniref:Gfo/Idh/MocA-like oxidoreductase C-terminal domain-containing protein n=1 Tax=Owenia fusiformis TaxID=6347 RepID=A0A8S4NUP0_OWEFU|nr:unnamed protein product [Owenia fusiformis]
MENAENCKEVVRVCKEEKVQLVICTVLRYLPESRRITELVNNGVVGDILNIQMIHHQGNVMYSHCYIRGNWSHVKTGTSFLIGCCHDIDLITQWMGDRRCISVTSFGSNIHLNKQNKPPEAGKMCVDCPVEEKCQFSAKKIYLDPFKKGDMGFPVNLITPLVPDIEGVTKAINTTKFGECVYDLGTEQLDNQVVNLMYEGGSTVSMSHVGITSRQAGRTIKIFGTKGEIESNLDGSVTHYDLETNTKSVWNPEPLKVKSQLTQFGGADFHLMDTFVDSVARRDSSRIPATIESSLYSHLLTFEIDRAQRENTILAISPELGVL